ncbi:MAG: signal peptidase I [Alkaliphilus sp.]
MLKEVFEWVKAIVISIVIALIITTFINPTIVRQHSMYPTLNEYDFLIVNRLLYKQSIPSAGDIVVFNSSLKTVDGEKKLLIKRVIAIPNDEILISNGNVYLNDRLVNEKYLGDIDTFGKDVEGVKLTIPKGRVFVMGDNRSNSMDSRDNVVGLVDIDDIVGKAFIRLFPFNKFELFNSEQ